MYFYAARQPILDANKNLFGYELLFRDGVDNIFPDINGNDATTKIVEASCINIELGAFTKHKPAFINFTLDTISKGLPHMLTTNEVVVEVLETEKPGKRLLSACKELFDSGYSIALDHYEHRNVWAHFYPYVKIIKIDVLTHPIENIPEIKKAIEDHPHIKLCAEKVETHEVYQQYLDLGFELFQGYFFAKPEVVKAKNPSPSQIAMAELLYESSKPELDLKQITHVFEHDVTLSYKLLRYVNSAIFRRSSEISTIKQALVTLGSGELKRFITLMFAVTANPDKPTELISQSMACAKFCELLSNELNQPVNTSISFLTGLLSLIDAILDEDLESVLDKLPLSTEIKESLLNKKGIIAAMIKLFDLIENAQWDKADELIERLKIDKEIALRIYNNALTWADEQSSAFE